MLTTRLIVSEPSRDCPRPRSRGRFVRSAAPILVLSLGIAGLFGGCSNRDNELAEANRALTDRVQALTQDNEGKDATIANLQRALDGRDQALSQVGNDLAAERAARLRTDDQLRQFDERLSGIGFGALDPETDRALREMAGQYPNILVYDSELGMIRFASDLTFGSGSDALSDQAKTALGALAQILNATATAGYDVRIVGHTDSQQISANTARLHPTNLHLSAHRSISVFNHLRSLGVASERLEIAGRGEFQPVVPNRAPKGNTPENRRVEVYLVRAVRPSSLPAPTNAPSEAGAGNRANEDIMK